MAIQTVDFANIDTVIKDGAILSEIVLDGSIIWTAPLVLSEAVGQLSSVYNTPSPIISERSALSSDGLVFVVFLQQGASDGSLYIYSRPSITSSNFTLLDTIAEVTNKNVINIELNDDGSVILWATGGQFSPESDTKIAVDDGAGSYILNQTFLDTKAASLGRDGNTVAYITDSSLEVLFNIGSKAVPNWLTAFTHSIPSATRSVAVSKRNANGVTVATGFEQSAAFLTFGSNRGYRGTIHRYVMAPNFSWTEAEYYLGPSVAGSTASTQGGVGGELAISDDGRTIISSLDNNRGVGVDNTSFSILTTNLATDQLELQYSSTLPLSVLSDLYTSVYISGNGGLAGARFADSTTRFIYGRNAPYDSSFDVLEGTHGDISSDGTTACVGNTVYEFIPLFTLSSTGLPILNEGQSINIRLNSLNVASGTVVDYTITGIQAADLVEPLTGSFTMLDSVAYQVLNAVSDLTTEGNQTATMTLDDYPSIALDFTILDTSTTP